MEVDTGRAGPTLDLEEVVADISMLQDTLRHFTPTVAVGHLDDTILLTKMLLLQVRYERFGAMGDLEKAIEAGKRRSLEHHRAITVG